MNYKNHRWQKGGGMKSRTSYFKSMITLPVVVVVVVVVVAGLDIDSID